MGKKRGFWFGLERFIFRLFKKYVNLLFKSFIGVSSVA